MKRTKVEACTMAQIDLRHAKPTSEHGYSKLRSVHWTREMILQLWVPFAVGTAVTMAIVSVEFANSSKFAFPKSFEVDTVHQARPTAASQGEVQYTYTSSHAVPSTSVSQASVGSAMVNVEKVAIASAEVSNGVAALPKPERLKLAKTHVGYADLTYGEIVTRLRRDSRTTPSSALLASFSRSSTLTSFLDSFGLRVFVPRTRQQWFDLDSANKPVVIFVMDSQSRILPVGTETVLYLSNGELSMSPMSEVGVDVSQWVAVERSELEKLPEERTSGVYAAERGSR